MVGKAEKHQMFISLQRELATPDLGFLFRLSTTTTDPERTYPWGKTHPKRARFNHPKSGRSWPFAKRVDCSIATNDEQPEYRVRAHDF